MKRSLAASLVALAAVFGGAPVWSQNAGQTPLGDIIATELPPETKALADRLVQLAGTARLFDSLLPNIADTAKNTFIRANPQMQLGIIAIVDKVAVELVSRRPELDAYLARVWASGFTNDEMQELIDFYSSETGQKFAKLHGQMLAVQTAAANDWASAVADELDRRVREELRAAAEAEQKALENDVAGPAQEPKPQQ
ncbi:MAG: DUF2059 domain-containing protein [Propylenella sp.]